MKAAELRDKIAEFKKSREGKQALIHSGPTGPIGTREWGWIVDVLEEQEKRIAELERQLHAEGA